MRESVRVYEVERLDTYKFKNINAHVMLIQQHYVFNLGQIYAFDG